MIRKDIEERKGKGNKPTGTKKMPPLELCYI